MKRLWIVLMAFFALVSCKISPQEWEEDYTGSWELIGIADMNWHSIEDLTNIQLAHAIDRRLTDDYNPMQMNFGSRRIQFVSDDETLDDGRYTIDEDGGIMVDWDDHYGDVYWMFALNDVLYMIEFSLDDFGELSGEQTAFKFRRLSKKVRWQQ